MISQITQKTLKTLGNFIAVARRDRAFSQSNLAERLGVARQTVIAIEKGDSKVAIGTVFEAAYILGIPLFSTDKDTQSKWQSVLTNFSAILPKRSRRKKPKVSDDF